eukprot:scaffold22443_cov112-Isochrysis_galbana.AAC.4
MWEGADIVTQIHGTQEGVAADAASAVLPGKSSGKILGRGEASQSQRAPSREVWRAKRNWSVGARCRSTCLRRGRRVRAGCVGGPPATCDTSS